MSWPVPITVALAGVALLTDMALHDEAAPARGPLATAYAAYRRRAGMLLLLPRRARGDARDA